MGPTRQGGVGTGPDGEIRVWSVAEGSRGARWREVASREGAVRRSVLLEVAPDGRPARLEIATIAGLMTLHPEPDESALHGNVVTPDGVRHHAFPWSPGHQLVVLPSPMALATVVRAFGESLLVGGQVPIPVVWVDDALAPEAEAWVLTYADLGTWWFGPTGSDRRAELRLGPTGLPLLRGPADWPLERDGG